MNQRHDEPPHGNLTGDGAIGRTVPPLDPRDRAGRYRAGTDGRVTTGLVASVKHAFDYPVDPGNEWDELVSRSTSDLIFQQSAWLRACIDTYCRDFEVLVPEVRKNGVLVAAAALRERDGIIEFAGIDRSDICNLVVSRDLGEDEAILAIEALLIAARNASARFRYFLLCRLPLEDRTVRYLRNPDRYLYPRACGMTLAPSMDMAVAREKLAKKHLRSLESSLNRAGKLESRTLTRAADIVPRLEEFFEQHIERWAGTTTPSFFLKERNRQFYHRMMNNLAGKNWVRFTVLELDGRMIAAHLGWLYDGRFCWYKPTFDTRLKKHSPGQVLLKRVIEQALGENAEEFDFLRGNESYKSRFATRERELISLEIYTSRFAATAKRIRQLIARKLHSGYHKKRAPN